MNELVTERELAQARNDPAFRQQFLARNLGRLLEALKTMRHAKSQNPSPSVRSRKAQTSP